MLLVALLCASYWQQWSRSATAVHMGIDRFSVKVEPEGLKVSIRLYDIRCDWSAIDRIDIRKAYLLVTYLKSPGVAIPVAAFGDDTALQAFVAAARSYKSGTTAV